MIWLLIHMLLSEPLRWARWLLALAVAPLPVVGWFGTLALAWMLLVGMACPSCLPCAATWNPNCAFPSCTMPQTMYVTISSTGSACDGSYAMTGIPSTMPANTCYESGAVIYGTCYWKYQPIWPGCDTNACGCPNGPGATFFAQSATAFGLHLYGATTFGGFFVTCSAPAALAANFGCNCCGNATGNITITT